MRFSEVISISMSLLCVNKLRSFLTMFGITVGVFSVVSVMTAILALRSSIETGISFLGANVFQFAKYPAGDIGWKKCYLRRNITLDQARRYQKLMEDVSSVVCLKFLNQGGAQAVYSGRQTTFALIFGGSNQNFLSTNQYSIESGRNLTGGDVDLGQRVCVIGQLVREKLFPSEAPLGKRIKVNGYTYTVIGTFEMKGSQFGQSQDDIVLIPITRYFSDFGSQNVSIDIATQAENQLVYDETMDKAITMMRIVRGLRPEQENDFEVYSNDSMISAFNQMADTIAVGSFMISGIALLVAGVGVMNITLVSVIERTKEIGICKSIGARKKSILAQFLVEAVTISLAGGLLGTVLGVAGGNGVAIILHVPVVFPWNWALIGLIVCAGIGVSFGFYPAWKAASLDPIEALRFE